MRVGISGIAVNNLSGLGRLNRAVILALAQQAEGFELHVFLRDESDMRLLQEECSRQSALLLENINPHFSKSLGLKRPLIEEFELPARFAGLGLDAYIGCDFTLPARRVAKREYLFLPDLLPFTRNRAVNPLSGWWYRRGVLRALRRKAHLLCISKATERALTQLFPRHGCPLSVVYPALPPRLIELAQQPPASDYSIQVQGSLHSLTDPGPFVLAVGVMGARKNAALMVRVFRQTVTDGGYRGSFVLAGGDGRFHTPPSRPQMAFATISPMQGDEPGPRPEIYDIGRVNDFDLSQLYRKADLLLNLSTEEGFGYPVLEALAHGTPALVTAGSSMTEIADGGIAATSLEPQQAEQRMISAVAALPLLRQEAKALPIERYGIERLGDELVALLKAGAA